MFLLERAFCAKEKMTSLLCITIISLTLAGSAFSLPTGSASQLKGKKSIHIETSLIFKYVSLL